MKFGLFYFLLFTGAISKAFPQKLNGQWTGSFQSKSYDRSEKTDYVLELECKGTEVTGYSYTYFNLGSRRCYTICRLAGNYEPESRSVSVSEVEKIKSNTPPDFRDCLQKHVLTYMKSKGKEVLVGKWAPTSDKENCGSGETELERRQLVKVVPQKPISPPVARRGESISGKNNPPADQSKLVNRIPDQSNPELNEKTTKSLSGNILKKVDDNKNTSVNSSPKSNSIAGVTPKVNLKNTKLISSIEVTSPNVTLQLFDNGQVDGDSVSIYLNGKMILSKQRLSAQPIIMNITLDNEEIQEFVMFAENLGAIPPNTALMVILSDDKKYEVNISLEEHASGAVRFIRKKG